MRASAQNQLAVIGSRAALPQWGAVPSGRTSRTFVPSSTVNRNPRTDAAGIPASAAMQPKAQKRKPAVAASTWGGPVVP